jgi:hypothetical protein
MYVNFTSHYECMLCTTKQSLGVADAAEGLTCRGQCKEKLQNISFQILDLFLSGEERQTPTVLGPLELFLAGQWTTSKNPAVPQIFRIYWYPTSVCVFLRAWVI